MKDTVIRHSFALDPSTDLDQVTYTTPSAFSNRQLATNLTCPFDKCEETPTRPSGTATAAPTSQQTGAASRARIPSIFRPLNMLRSGFLWNTWFNVGAQRSEGSAARVQQWSGSTNDTVEDEAEGRHTNNWAVLVCTSRYWFNYRVSKCLHQCTTLRQY